MRDFLIITGALLTGWGLHDLYMLLHGYTPPNPLRMGDGWNPPTHVKQVER